LISEKSNDVRQTGQVLFGFPRIPGSDLRDRHAVLCVSRSEHALGYLHDFLAQMLQGIGAPLAKIEEAAAYMTPAPRAGILCCADESGNRQAKDPQRHCFIKLYSSLHGKRWTLDPTGATYGLRFDVMAFGNYKISHVLFIAAEYLHAGIDMWILQSRLTLPQMLRLPDRDFRA
ncbi:hypothetical protein CC86DRAFT_268096, partial [Ophiobolus disseminans]